MMKATSFEYRHQLVLHELIVGAAFFTYLIDRDDVVWRFIKGNSFDVRFLERSLFAAATLLFGISAGICTLARAYPRLDRTGQSQGSASIWPLRPTLHLRYLGEFLYALALAFLLPLSGFFVLVIGEAVRLFRLVCRDDQASPGVTSGDDIALARARQATPVAAVSTHELKPEWANAFRLEAIKWGLFFTMIVFTLTLKDRVAEALIGVTILIWILLNFSLLTNLREVSLL